MTAIRAVTKFGRRQTEEVGEADREEQQRQEDDGCELSRVGAIRPTHRLQMVLMDSTVLQLKST